MKTTLQKGRKYLVFVPQPQAKDRKALMDDMEHFRQGLESYLEIKTRLMAWPGLSTVIFVESNGEWPESTKRPKAIQCVHATCKRMTKHNSGFCPFHRERDLGIEVEE